MPKDLLLCSEQCQQTCYFEVNNANRLVFCVLRQNVQENYLWGPKGSEWHSLNSHIKKQILSEVNHMSINAGII